MALLKAEQAINLQELGIGPLRIRQSATGARLIELPGSTSGGKADVLAARLKEVLVEEAEVLRPEKKADLRVSGLSDAVDAERLSIAVAKEGGCNPGQVLVRNIRTGQVGSGTGHIELPAAEAKKLLKAGSIAGEARVRMSPHIKYLGLILDGGWTFLIHRCLPEYGNLWCPGLGGSLVAAK